MFVNSETKTVASQELQEQVQQELQEEDKAIASILKEIEKPKENNGEKPTK